jgi:hypothetical protein
MPFRRCFLEPGFTIGAINAATGDPIWNMTFWNGGGDFSGGMAMADGYMALLNSYDNQIYAFGKGPTATTVQTPLTGVTAGQSLIIQGTVMDISAGTKQDTITPRFPNGVPAVADDNQTARMEVRVHAEPEANRCYRRASDMTIIESNGNPNIDTVMTDGVTGSLSYVVTQSVLSAGAGKYTVIASFDGTNSYWPSSSLQSSFLISSEAVVTPAPTSAPTSPVDAEFLPFNE